MSKSKVIIVTGPSASGKTTVSRKVLGKEVVSVTTRQPRPNEKPGEDYIFLTENEFQQYIQDGKLAEWVNYNGNFYGVLANSIEKDLKELGYALVIATKEGKDQLIKMFPDAITVFLYGTREDVLENIRKRGDSEEVIQNRIATYETELANKCEYDYVIKNNRGQFHTTCNIFRSILKSEGINV